MWFFTPVVSSDFHRSRSDSKSRQLPRTFLGILIVLKYSELRTVSILNKISCYTSLFFPWLFGIVEGPPIISQFSFFFYFSGNVLIFVFRSLLISLLSSSRQVLLANYKNFWFSSVSMVGVVVLAVAVVVAVVLVVVVMIMTYYL